MILQWRPFFGSTDYLFGVRGYQYRVVDGNRIVKSDWFPASYGSDRSGVVTGLTNGTTYQFHVRAMKRGPATRYIQWVGGPWTRDLPATPEGPPPDHCIQTLEGDGSVTGRWVLNHDNINKGYVPECPSFSHSGHAARYYRFTVPEGVDREVTPEVDASTGFRLDWWKGLPQSKVSDGEKADPSNLPPGDYTVEVTTAVRLFPREAEEFTLTLSGTGRSVPDPGGGGGAGTGTEQQEQQGQQQQGQQQGQVQQEQESQLKVNNTRTRPSVGNRLRPPRPGTTSLVFPVTLSPAASEPVQVDYTTRNGTARAGEDYVSASGTLTFVPGQTAQTVAVAVLPGERPGDGETMTLELSNPQGGGAVIANGQGVGTILTVAAESPTVAVEQQTTRLGRTVAEQVLDAVDARMGSAPSPGLAVTLAGQPLQWPTVADTSQPVTEQVMEQVADHLTQWVSISDGNVAVRRLDGNELLASSSFALNTPSSGGGLLSFWGGGAVTTFDGREGDLSLDGKVTTWLLGVDWHWGQWPDGGNARRSTAGLVVSRSSSSGGYDSGSGGIAGDVDSTLTGAFPWMRYRFTERLEVWGAAGYGQGDLKVTPKHPGTNRKGAALETDLNLWLAAGGLRGTLLEGGNDGLTLTGKSDVMAVSTSSGSAGSGDGRLEAADARVTRLRLALEAERPIPFGKAESDADADARGTLTPSLEVAMRYDGGDGDAGFGLDLGGGITLSHPSHGLQAELRGRGLLSHAAEGFRDRGFSGSLSWRQRPDSDLGAMVSLHQTVGGAASGGADALLNRVTLEGLAANNGNGSDDLKHQRLELQLGYGFTVFGDRFTLTPELGLGFYNTGRDYRIGWNLKRPGDGDALDLSFDLTRRENTGNDGATPEHGVRFGVNTRF